MRRLLAIALVSFALLAKAQEEVGIEKSLFGVQAGIMGIWANHELKLANTVALRTEIGFVKTNWIIGTKKEEPIIPLVLTVEPKCYFNIAKRYSQGKRIDNNAAEYFSIQMTYQPLFILGKQNSNISIIPTYAQRSNIGKHFNYEVGGGMGYGYFFKSGNNDLKYGSDWAFNIVLRIGYTFSVKRNL